MAAIGIWLVVNGKLQTILIVLYSFQESNLSYNKTNMCGLLILTIIAIISATRTATQHPLTHRKEIKG
jgi:hypothetical protein